jgi:hypothetical protein
VWVNGQAFFTFGKHDGEALSEVASSDRQYLVRLLLW